MDFSPNLQTWGSRVDPGVDRPVQSPRLDDFENSLAGIFNLQSSSRQNFPKKYGDLYVFEFEYTLWHLHCIVAQVACTSILGSLLTLQRLWSQVGHLQLQLVEPLTTDLLS